MASIGKRGNRWFARYRDNTGREHARRFDRKIDAQRWLDEATAALVTHQFVDPRAGRTTVAEYARRWAAGRPHKPKTAERTESIIRTHIEGTSVRCTAPRFGAAFGAAKLGVRPGERARTVHTAAGRRAGAVGVLGGRD